MIRAKIWVANVDEKKADDGTKYQEIVKAHAVSTGTPEDNSYAAATPCLDLTITIDNPAAFGKLVPSQNYYLDFTPAS